MRKHGPENFSWEVIHRHWDRDYCLKTMEPLFISMFESNKKDKGYNVTSGGEGTFGFKHSDEVYAKRSEKVKGKFEGINSPSADKTKYDFENFKTGETFNGTPQEFKTQHSVIKDHDLASIVREKKRAKNWKLKESTARGRGYNAYGYYIGFNENTEETVYIKDLTEFAKMRKLSRNSLYGVVTGQRKSNKGWVIKRITKEEYYVACP